MGALPSPYLLTVTVSEGQLEELLGAPADEGIQAWASALAPGQGRGGDGGLAGLRCGLRVPRGSDGVRILRLRIRALALGL